MTNQTDIKTKLEQLAAEFGELGQHFTRRTRETVPTAEDGPAAWCTHGTYEGMAAILADAAARLRELVADEQVEAPSEPRGVDQHIAVAVKELRANLVMLEFWLAEGINEEFGKFGNSIPVLYWSHRNNTRSKVLWLLRKKLGDYNMEENISTFELMQLAGREETLAALDEVISELI